MKTTAFLGLFLLSSTLLGAEVPSPEPERLVGLGYIFPSTANAPGANGAYYRTRMVLTNPHTTKILLAAVLDTPGGDAGKKWITLEAGETRIYENFLQDVFAYTGAGGVGLQEITDTRPFFASGEVWTESANGRFSTPLTGLWSPDRVVNLRLKDTGVSLSAGVRVNAANRANLGCVNIHLDAAQVRADIFNEGSATVPAAQVVLDLPPSGWAQTSVPVSGENIRIFFWQLTGGGEVHGAYCYAVNVNNQSNDGTSIPAARIDRIR